MYLHRQVRGNTSTRIKKKIIKRVKKAVPPLKVEQLTLKAMGMHVCFIFTKSEFKSRRDT